MAYRDRRMSCPRCGVELVGYPEREKWRCRDCVGVLAGPNEMPIQLTTVDWPTAKRRTHEPLGCPACGDEMQPFSVGDLKLERCERDGYVWFDGGELGFLHAYFAEPL